MLIRSQDKRILVNVNHIDTIRIEKSENGGHELCAYNGNGYTKMEFGTYSTEEKSIKVLDMIQEKYLQYATIESGFGNIHGAFNVPKVFQMPQDSEV